MSREQATKVFGEAFETGEVAELLVFIADNLRLNTCSEGLQYVCTSLYSEAEKLFTDTFGSAPMTCRLDPTANLECTQRLDAREVMTHLLAIDITHGVTAATLPCLVGIWRRTYAQLVLDTMRRRRTVDARVTISTLALAMQGWTNDLLLKLSTEILPSLVTKDAYLDEALAGEEGFDEAVPGACGNPDEQEVFVAHTLIAGLELCKAFLIADSASWNCVVLTLLGVCWSRPRCSVAAVRREVQRLHSTLLNCSVACLTARGIGPLMGMYDEQLQECDARLSDYLYEDNERGKSEKNEKVLALLQAREAELDEMMLFKVKKDERGTVAPPLKAWTSLGGLCVLGSSLLASPDALLLFSESSSVFMSFVPLLSQCLKTTSVSGLLFSLSFLLSASSSVPKYSLVLSGEETTRFLWSNDPTNSSLSFKTKRYEALFNLLKQLIVISTTCHNEDCREQSKIAILSILVLFNQEGRVRLQSSLITLCPYPSVVVFLLNDLVNMWREYNSDDSQWTPLKIMEEDFPISLWNALRSFHKNILLGQAEFVDPLVAVINFLYVFLMLDVKQQSHVHQRLSYTQKKIRWTPVQEGKRCTWLLVFEQFKRDFLPQLERLLATANSGGPVELLRPVDTFALTSSLDMLKAFF